MVDLFLENLNFINARSTNKHDAITSILNFNVFWVTAYHQEEINNIH